MEEKKNFKIFGNVLIKENKRGVSGLIVEALDKDLLFDDRLGEVVTNKTGNFEIQYDKPDFQELFFDRKPDIYLRIKSPNGEEIYTTEDKVRYEASKTEKFIIELPNNLIRNKIKRDRYVIKVSDEQFQQIEKYYKQSDAEKDEDDDTRYYRRILPDPVAIDICQELKKQYYNIKPKAVSTSVNILPDIICIPDDMHPDVHLPEGHSPSDFPPVCFERDKEKAKETDDEESDDDSNEQSTNQATINMMPTERWNALYIAYMLNCPWAKKILDVE